MLQHAALLTAEVQREHSSFDCHQRVRHHLCEREREWEREGEAEKREGERQRERVCVCVCVCMCVTCVTSLVLTAISASESLCVCARERENERARERVCVCAWEREREHVWNTGLDCHERVRRHLFVCASCLCVCTGMYVAVCCSMLRCAVVRGNVYQCVAVCEIWLVHMRHAIRSRQGVAACCSVCYSAW